jgi:FkbM family methyltransferase
MNLAPIALFVYNRPWHTRQTLEALAANEWADQSVLYIFADGAKADATEEQLANIAAVRQLIRSRQWCKEVHIIERQRNWGLADNIIDGVTQIVNQYGRIIVLEDDLVTSPGFLRYMNEALELYANEPRVMHISGYMFPVKGSLPETFFYNANSCWGWATWARAWQHFINDPLYLYKQITKSKKTVRRFNINNSYPFLSQLEANMLGKTKRWAVRWYASFFIRGGFALHPYPSLVNNIGHDNSGENCTPQDDFHWPILAKNIPVKPQPIRESRKARKLMEYFYRYQLQIPAFATNPNWFSRLKGVIGQYVPKKLMYQYRLYKQPDFRIAEQMKAELHRIAELPRNQENTTTILLPHPVTFPDAASFLFIYDEIFVKKVYEFQADTEGPYIIDAGANIGMSVIYFKQLYPHAEVVAFEPDKSIAKYLHQNIASFGLSDVTVVEKALWHEETTLQFFSDGSDGGRIATDADHGEIISIPTIRLRNYLNRTVDLLKIDIEGAELIVLEDCKDLLHYVKHLFVEYHSFVGQPQQLGKLILLLEEAGFRLYVSAPGIASEQPFIEPVVYAGMDGQLNIHAVRQ